MDKKRSRKLFISLAITLTLAFVILLFSQSKTSRLVELKALDWRFMLKGNTVSRSPILHIDIDDQSLATLGRWPWPRSYHARLTKILKECQARVVLWDVLFMEELQDNPQDDVLFSSAMKDTDITYLPFYFVEELDKPVPALESMVEKDITVSIDEVSKSLGIKREELKEKLPLAKRYVMDKAVREILREYPEVSLEELLLKIEQSKGWFLFPEDEAYMRDKFENLKLSRYFINKFSRPCDGKSWPFQRTYKNLSVPIREYLDSATGSGHINAEPDRDGVMRRVPLFIKLADEDRILPQLTVAALLKYLKVEDVQFKERTVIFKNAHLGDRVKDIEIPTDYTGSIFVNWQGRWGYSYKHLPYYLILKLQDVREQLEAELAKEVSGANPDSGTIEFLRKSEAELRQKLTAIVKDNICLVGLTGTGTHDMRPMPLQANYPMVGTHSNLINTILTENFIRRKEGAVSVFIFILTAVIIALASLTKLWKSFLLSFGYAILYFLAATFLFIKFGLWIDLAGPLGIVILGFTSITSYRYFTEEKEKQWIKHAFSHYLSAEVINELMNDPDKLKLGGERRQITVLFSDVRGFTTFSESHQPEEVVAMLNEILTAQVKVVFKYGGTLDKFVGDELMAFFGAPGNMHAKDHALVAVKTAFDIQVKVGELHKKWSSEGKESLSIGIGVNTGDMVVGNMGSAERMDYTVIGDNVNLGARLCSAAGKGEIIISEATYEQAKDQITAEKLEPIIVKGKAKPISIYKVTGLKQG